MRIAILASHNGFIEAKGRSTMQFRKIVGTCTLAAVMVGSAAWADDTGFYLGAGVGDSRQEAGAFRGNDNAFKLFGGWSINKYFAVEGGFIDAGTRSDTIGPVDIDISSDGFFVEGLARWPIGNVIAPYAKLGYVFYDSTLRNSIGSQSFSTSESGSDLLYGAGLEFKTSTNFRLRVEFEEVNLPDIHLETYTLAALWQF
jgi:OmpA-OmpF porin, OOP family